jgi:hypothetical protein
MHATATESAHVAAAKTAHVAATEAAHVTTAETATVATATTVPATAAVAAAMSQRRRTGQRKAHQQRSDHGKLPFHRSPPTLTCGEDLFCLSFLFRRQLKRACRAVLH